MNKKIRKFKFLLALFLLVSCGIRVEDETFDNIFPGTWTVNTVQCFRAGVSVESYLTSKTGRTIQFKFENKSFIYTVVDPSDPGVPTDGCSINMEGQYSTVYSNATNGIISMFNLQNSNECVIELTDPGSNSDENVSFALVGVDAGSLDFSFNSNQLDMEFPTTFDGSSNSSLCGNACQCFLRMTKN